MSEVERFKSVDRWLTKLSKKSDSEHTKRNYLRWLHVFCDYVDMTPDELIEERENGMQEKDMVKRRIAEDRLDAWFAQLKETASPRTGKKYARNTVVAAYNAVRSFYKANYVELHVDEAPSGWPSKNKPGLTREELGRLLNTTRKLMHRAYTLCQAQSGLSVSDLLRVTYGGVANQIENGSDHIHLRL